MLRPIITLCISLIFSNTFAQNWQLFPPNQLNHYQVEGEKPSIRSFKSDSIRTTGESNIYLFTRYMGPSEDCYWQNFKWLYGYGNEFTIDSLVYDHDSIVYYFMEGNLMHDFVFKPMAKPGEEWNLSSHLGRKGSCTAAGVTEFLGVTDSIKTFSLQTAISDVEFILSKTHGLLQFIAFTDFFVEIPLVVPDPIPYAYYTLNGFQRNDAIRGFQMPEFSDYFHLSAGDQLLWKHTFYDLNDFTTNYYRDSLLSSLISEDSVSYEIIREVYDSSGKYIRNENTFSTYKRIEYEYLLQTPAKWYTTRDDDTDHGEIFFIKDMNLEFSEFDTIYHKEFSANGCSFFNMTDEPCYVACIDAFYETEYKVSTCEGLTYYSGFYGDELRLFGSVIKGKVRGTMNIPPVGIEHTGEVEFQIYPNPTTGIIHLTSDFEIRKVEIYNYLGILVHNSTITDPIDISDQTPGLYHLVIFTKTGERYIKLVSVIQ